MKLIGFFLVIYGWFSLDTYGIDLEHVGLTLLGIALMLHTEILDIFKKERYGR